MSALAGRAGSVKIGANTVLEIGEWSLNIDIDLPEHTDFGDVWKEHLVGLRGATGSFNGRLDPADTTGHVALITEALSGTSGVTLNLYINATNYFSMTALLSQMSPKASVGGVVENSYNFTATGAVSYN